MGGGVRLEGFTSVDPALFKVGGGMGRGMMPRVYGNQLSAFRLGFGFRGLGAGLGFMIVWDNGRSGFRVVYFFV